MEELTDEECSAFGLKDVRRRVLRGYDKIVKKNSLAGNDGLARTKSLKVGETDPSVRALHDSNDFGKVCL